MLNARRNDPVSSHLAGEQVERSGVAHNQRMIALAAVKAHPGHTSLELAEITGLDRYMLARRLPEITGMLRGLRRCSINKKISLTWDYV